MIALMTAILLTGANVSCGSFGSLDFFLPDSSVNSIMEKRILKKLGDSSIARCIIEKSDEVMIKGARRFCKKHKQGKTPKGLTLDGYFWSAGETLKLQCIIERQSD